jgi:hypothetical protein
MTAGRIRRMAREALGNAGLLPYLGLARDCLSKMGRHRVYHDWCTFQDLGKAFGRNGIAPIAGQGPTFLVYGVHSVPAAVCTLPIFMAARQLGYRVWVLLPTRNPMVRRAYQLCGVADFVYLEEFLAETPHPQAPTIYNSLATASDLKKISYKGCRIGKFCLSTLMRWNRMGDPDIADPKTSAMLRRELSHSLQAADAAEKIAAIVNPKLALFSERGYSPYGELFDSILDRGGECLTWNAGHRNNMLMLKRYHRNNIDANHFSLSKSSWERVKQMPWSDAHWNRLRDEIVGSYQSGEWFSECATQVDKEAVEHGALTRRLALDPARKTVCIFPHMFWDATFFWGEDLFDNYEHWFTEVLKVAAENCSVNWIIKIHPANVTKAIRDEYRGEYSETLAIHRALGKLADHIKVVPPDSDISTLSLLRVIDYCLTVRGTIGIEAATFGIRVLTAGTGRYDHRGFTLDYATREDYLRDLRQLPDLPAMTPEETQLARKFAYGVFIARPTHLASINLGFRRDLSAQLETSVRLDAAALPKAPDVRSMADWIASGDEDYLAIEAVEGDARAVSFAAGRERPEKISID